MEFKLKPFSKNLFPKSAVLVCHSSPRLWLQEIQQMGINLNEVSVYPVPSSSANVLYGCLIVFKNIPKKMDIGRNMFFQSIHNKLFIPENAIISPMISLEEIHQVFSEYYHVYHTDFGLVELAHEIDWMELVTDSKQVSVQVGIPSKSVFIPRSITSLRIEVNEEEILKQLDTPKTEQEFLENLPFDLKKVLSGNQKEIDKFLSYLDKHPEMALQLGIPLDVMNTSRGEASGKFRFNKKGSSLFDFSTIFGKSNANNNSSGSSFGSGIFGNFDSTVFQNSKYVFLKVILILFFLSKLITIGSIFIVLKWIFVLAIIAAIIIFVFRITDTDDASSKSNSGSAALLDSNRFSSLHKRYEDLAQDFISKKEYEKAAHVYLKLLQNKVRAAQVLEEGNMYQEAALVYLKHCQDKSKAAECYEKGKAYKEAIALYKEFNMPEKVGDLYMLLNQKSSANEYYYKVVDDYNTKSQFIKASLILKNKIGDKSKAQDLLLEGWRTNKDATNCLSYYFSDIENKKQLKYEIERVYKEETSNELLESLLIVIKKEYERSVDLKEFTKEIAYEIISKRIQQNPNIASELLSFNRTDTNIIKDVMKYKFNRKKSI